MIKALKKSWIGRNPIQSIFIAVVLVISGGLLGIIDLSEWGIAPLSTVPTGPSLPSETLGEDSAKWIITVNDKLDSSVTVTGTLDIYFPEDPGNRKESLSVTSGSATTVLPYREGKQLFCLFYSSTNTWLRYGEVITMPEIPGTGVYSSIQTLPANTESAMKVYKRADSSAATDILGFKGSTKIWDNATVNLGGVTSGGFNVTADRSDTVPPAMGIQLTNEDENTAYVDPRGYFDYSIADAGDAVALYANKASYLVITFQRTGSSANVSDVREYCVYEDESGITMFQQDSSIMYMFVPLNTELLAGTNEKVGETQIQSGQRITIFDRTFDWPASKATDIYTDDIDMEVGLLNAFSIAGIEKKLDQTGMELIGEFGDNSATYGGAAWTNDWSIGDI